MNILLTGASGILGSDISSQLKESGHNVLGFSSSDIDLFSYQDVKTKVHDFKPEIVIHSAAVTNVDLCEEHHEIADQINIIGSENIAKASRKIDAKVIYISSCGVYGNGKISPYNESDETNPVTYHHYSKLEGEKRVRKFTKKFLIVRPGWLFGGTPQHKKNFVEARKKDAFNASLIKSAGDKFGSPTYTADLAKQILYLMEEGFNGTFNVVNEGCASRFEYVTEIVKLLKMSTIVESVNSDAFPRKANMPANECLENRNLSQANVNKMRSWKVALKEYINLTYQS
ncbi:SDR family oxidoreductase [Mucilaginibacter sp.]|uniref:SDR family oxidoreductase n=1 Tax=Mucilaginibacter sp. TaxID=1882438 RepID=UPI003D0D74BF